MSRRMVIYSPLRKTLNLVSVTELTENKFLNLLQLCAGDNSVLKKDDWLLTFKNSPSPKRQKLLFDNGLYRYLLVIPKKCLSTTLALFRTMHVEEFLSLCWVDV